MSWNASPLRPGGRRPVWAIAWICLGRAIALGLALGTVSGGFQPAGAARWVPLTVEQLATRADLVVHARVESLECRADAAGRIFTRVGMLVLEVWKGRTGLAGGADGRLEAVQGGGVLGDRAVRGEGQAAYQVGDEVVAYLVRNEAGEWVTLGLGQGRFEVVAAGPGSPERRVRNPFWGADPATPGAHGQPPNRRPLTLEELRRRTREVAP